MTEMLPRDINLTDRRPLETLVVKLTLFYRKKKNIWLLLSFAVLSKVQPNYSSIDR